MAPRVILNIPFYIVRFMRCQKRLILQNEQYRLQAYRRWCNLTDTVIISGT